MLPTIVAVLVVVAIGAAFLAYRYRSERGIESGISSFRRELGALAPRRDTERPPSPEREPGTTSGVGILRPDPTDENDEARAADADDGTPDGRGADGDDPDEDV